MTTMWRSHTSSLLCSVWLLVLNSNHTKFNSMGFKCQVNDFKHTNQRERTMAAGEFVYTYIYIVLSCSYKGIHKMNMHILVLYYAWR